MSSDVTKIPPRVEAGSIIAFRLYDVAYAIDLDAVERIAAAQAPTSRIRFRRALTKSIDFGVPPVEIALAGVELELPGGRVAADVTARVHHFGSISLAVRIGVEGREWGDFVALVRDSDRLLSSDGWTGWQERLDRVREIIAPAVRRPTSWGMVEDYLVTVVRRFDRPVEAEELLADVDLPMLLAREAQPLSSQSRRELMRHAYSYYPSDLVVLTWDHAFVLEPGDDLDVVDVLEVANAQLLEIRYWDELLDGELPRMYEQVERAREAFGGLSRRRHANVARRLHARVAEVRESAERVDNALIVTEDVYLARIYGAAIELFRVGAWTSAVDRKLAIMRDTYTALYDEAATARAEILEAGILLLIVFEILMAFVR